MLELDAGGALSAVNVYAPDGLVAREAASSLEDQPVSHGGTRGFAPVRLGETQYAFDPEGSVAQRLDSRGAALSSSAYDAYGGVVSQAGDPKPEPFGYHARDGYYGDAETGLYYCRNRYHDPGTVRWAAHDPIGANGGIDLYGYCEGGPVGWSDPSGLIPPVAVRGGGQVAQGIGTGNSDGVPAYEGHAPYLPPSYRVAESLGTSGPVGGAVEQPTPAPSQPDEPYPPYGGAAPEGRFFRDNGDANPPGRNVTPLPGRGNTNPSSRAGHPNGGYFGPSGMPRSGCSIPPSKWLDEETCWSIPTNTGIPASVSTTAPA